ncbi:hypothetical protein CYLTODRAFT_363744 [Cylindrobasidium torrendii FP15055 ss-10]|uniref:Uncharacterized protein n=1 Tax=Cylindrobasidium torrendii FP15055 ss-10 TaxID=1314674 RepID=A0A0D7AQW6_9AGAR|nr:hypothetical protein CYLTODRAFT_363744 [Cylindrobasidium torrendii FP15055 ss-10]
MSSEELDRRIRRLPPGLGLKHFKNGISALSQVSGSERKNMGKILLACVHSELPKEAVIAVRVILDFIYLAQYSSHNAYTLKYMDDCLDAWKKNKWIFISVEARTDFNIPKVHSLRHYVQSIRLFGTTNNYNTEMFERLHIEYAKKGWRASNRRDEFPQMTRWVIRQETVHAFDRFLRGLVQETGVSYLSRIEKRKARVPQLYKAAKDLPFERIDVYHSFRLELEGLNDDDGEQDWVKASPSDGGRYDTVVVLDGDEADMVSLNGTRIGRVHLIFTLPRTMRIGSNDMPLPVYWPNACPLAYITWYTKPSQNAAAKATHNMVSVSKDIFQGAPRWSIIPLSNIRQSCMLVPNFGKTDVRIWDTEASVLDTCTHFFINNWLSLYSYQTLYLD